MLKVMEKTSRLKSLLDGKFIFSHGNAVDELEGRPEPMKLCALFHIHDTVGGWGSSPNRITQKLSNSGENNFKDGEATAEAFLCQQISVPCQIPLFLGPILFNVFNNVECGVLSFQSLLLRFRLFSFCKYRSQGSSGYSISYDLRPIC